MNNKIWIIIILFTLLKDRLCAYKRNYQARSRNHCCRENSKCVSAALPIHHGRRMSRIVIVPYLAVPYSSTSCHKQHNFREEVTEHNMCSLVFSTILV